MIVLATGCGHAHVALGPAADQRPVLEQEEQAERGEGEEHRERGQRRRRPSRARRSARGTRRSRPSSRRPRPPAPARAHARVLQPALDLVDRPLEAALEALRLRRRSRASTSTASAAPPAATRRTRCAVAAAARHARAAERATTGESTAAMIVAVMTGTTIVLISDSSHDRAGEQRGDADEQPRHHAEVAQPPGRGEHADELHGLHLDGLAAVGAAPPPPARHADRSAPSLRLAATSRAHLPTACRAARARWRHDPTDGRRAHHPVRTKRPETRAARATRFTRCG